MKLNTYKIRYLMRQKGICNYQIAKRLDITETYISQILNRRRTPSKKVVEGIAKFLLVEVSEIIEEEQNNGGRITKTYNYSNKKMVPRRRPGSHI